MVSVLLALALASSPPTRVGVWFTSAPPDAPVAGALRLRVVRELSARGSVVVDLQAAKAAASVDQCRDDLGACLARAGALPPEVAVFVEYADSPPTLRLQLRRPGALQPLATSSRSGPDRIALLDGLDGMVDELLEPLAFPAGRVPPRAAARKLAIEAFALGGASLVGSGVSIALSLGVSTTYQHPAALLKLSPAEVHDIRRQGEWGQTGAAVLLGVAGLCAATGLGALYLARPPEFPRVILSAGPSGARLALAGVFP